MKKDFIYSTLAEIFDYPCEYMIGKTDIAMFMKENCNKWCDKHCREQDKKKCWKKFFKKWEKATRLRIVDCSGVSLETAEKVLQTSLFASTSRAEPLIAAPKQTSLFDDEKKEEPEIINHIPKPSFIWKCPHCGLEVHSDFHACPRCGCSRKDD